VWVRLEREWLELGMKTKEERGGFIDGYWCWWTWDEERTRKKR
jgi:hypothetical protein